MVYRLLAGLCVFVTSLTAHASSLSYEVGASQGKYNEKEYQEVNLGINWRLNDYITWRNSGFSRTVKDQDPRYGLDTSLRLDVESDRRAAVGAGFFIGAGYRFSKKTNSGVLGEAGIKARGGGLRLSVGAKGVIYQDPEDLADGTAGKKEDISYFVNISGSGTLGN
jgi:hypothetical protein